MKWKPKMVLKVREIGDLNFKLFKVLGVFASYKYKSLQGMYWMEESDWIDLLAGETSVSYFVTYYAENSNFITLSNTRKEKVTCIKCLILKNTRKYLTTHIKPFRDYPGDAPADKDGFKHVLPNGRGPHYRHSAETPLYQRGRSDWTDQAGQETREFLPRVVFLFEGV